MKKALSILCSIIVAAFCLGSCSDVDLLEKDTINNLGRRQPLEDQGFDNVFLAYLAGYNSLHSYISTNISELATGYIPKKHDRTAVLVFSHLSKNRLYSEPVSPVLIRLYTENDKVVFDTLKVFDSAAISASASVLKETLLYVQDQFPSSCYGMLISSHGSGWVPSSYKLNSETRSIWAQFQAVGYQNTSGATTYQIDIEDFRAALPFHLRYVIFDACLMGGVETLYTMRDACDYIVASPAEIPGKGFDYCNMGSYLFGSTPDLFGFCDYCCVTSEREGTIGLYKCSQAQALADAVKPIYASLGSTVFSLNEDTIQGYNFNYDYNYDFRDFCVALGATPVQLSVLDSALDSCVVFKKSTTRVLNFIVDPSRYCGITTFLPKSYTPNLNALYQQTSWNLETGLL